MTITYFFDDVPFDVDNIPKPILEALIGLVYVDDSQVSDLICRKRELTEDLQIRNPSPDLLEFLDKSEQVLHISVVNTLSFEVTF